MIIRATAAGWKRSNRTGACRYPLAGLLVISATLSGNTRAADTTNAPALTEIIVTAQKRQENIQDVPVSVMALSGQQLQDAGVKDIKNLQVLTPGVTVTSTTSENVTTARIRGVGTVGDNPGLESSVGVIVDGVYRARNGVGFGDLGEIERIEVLEGPQGELFGKNNDAGVINVVTKRPSSTFGVTGEVTGGNYNDREISASVTGPLGDISAARFYVGYQRRDGFLNVDTAPGPNTDNNTDNRNVYTMRGQYLLTPNDNVSFLAIADYSKRNESCCGAIQTADGPFYGLINALAGVPQLGGTPGVTGIASPPLSLSSREAWANQPVTQRIRDMGISGQLDWDLGFGKLTSISAWRNNTLIAGNDVDYTSVDIVQEPADEGNLVDFKQISQELRLAGKNGALDWLVGGFFSNELLVSNTAIFAGNDFDLYLSGLSSAAVGPPNFLLTTGLTGKPPRQPVHSGRIRRGRLVPRELQKLRVLHQRDLQHHAGTGSDGRFAVHLHEEDRGFELCQSGWRLGVRPTALESGGRRESRESRKSVPHRLGLRDSVQSVLRRQIDRSVAERGQCGRHGQARLSLHR